MKRFQAGNGSLRQRVAGLPLPVWVVCAGMFINKLGNFLSVFLVLYLTHKGYSAFLAGSALGALGLGSFVGNGVGGVVADRLGRRFAVITSMFGSAGLILLVPVSAANIYTTIALTVTIGFFSQLYRPAAGAILIDSALPDQRITAFGLFRLAINLGMSIGPVIGGVLSGSNYDYLFVGNAVASGSFGVIALGLLHETRPARQPAHTGKVMAPGGYRDVLADRSLRLYMFSFFAATYVYTQTTATLPLHVQDDHMSNSFYGLLLGVNALLCVLIELPLTRFTGHRPPGRILAIGMGLLSLGVGLTGVANTHITLLLTVVLWTVAETIFTPVATAYPGLLAPERLRGRYQATEGISATLAQTVGPALGGYLYAANQSLHWSSCGVIALVAALVVVFCEDPRDRAAHVPSPDAADASTVTP